jgi:hypothetical protein
MPGTILLISQLVHGIIGDLILRLERRAGLKHFWEATAYLMKTTVMKCDS